MKKCLQKELSEIKFNYVLQEWGKIELEEKKRLHELQQELQNLL